jgi:Holliday junction resolvase RusA-like endonuclease
MTDARLPIHLTIFGELASKANSRRLVTIAGKPRFILSKKALAWQCDARLQIPTLDPLIEGPLSISVSCMYASERPDLDASLLFDMLQGRLYKNDRQLREMHLFHAIDKMCPRAEVLIQRRTTR